MRICKYPIFSFINVLLTSGGIAGIALVFLKLKDSFWHLCPQCSTFHYVVIGVSCFLILMGLLGLMATEMKSKWLLIVYKFGLFLLFLIAAAYTVGVILLKVGTLDHLLQIGWDEGVSSDQHNVCEFQYLWTCTGWNDLCPQNLLNATTSCPVCPKGLRPGNPPGLTTCENKMHQTADSDFKSLLIGGIASIVFIILLNFIAYCNGRSFRYIDDPDDYMDDKQINRRMLDEQKEMRTGGGSYL